MNVNLNLGYSSAGSPVVWSDADNSHASVVGQSGTGKSYFLKGLLEQAAGAGAKCVVFDYTADFHDYKSPEGILCRYIDTGSMEFSMNPLIGADHEVVAQRLLSAIHAAFRLGSKGSMALRKAALTYLNAATAPTLDGLAAFIRSLKSTPGLDAALEPVELLGSLLHCGNEYLGLDLNVPGLTILGFDRFYDVRLRATLIELILSAIWNKWTSEFDHQHPLILLLDESQNLNWSESGMPIKILREGRKHHLAGWFATQWVSKPEAVPALGQAALQVTFRPDDVNVLSLAKQMANGNKSQVPQYQKILRSLRRGQFLLQRSDGRAIIVNVPARNEKGGNEQR